VTRRIMSSTRHRPDREFGSVRAGIVPPGPQSCIPRRSMIGPRGNRFNGRRDWAERRALTRFRIQPLGECWAYGFPGAIHFKLGLSQKPPPSRSISGGPIFFRRNLARRDY